MIKNERKYCIDCKDFKSLDGLNNIKSPVNCDFFMSSMSCKKFEKIDSHLKEYFPLLIKDHGIDKDAENQLIAVQQLIEPTEELCYWSLRINIASREIINKSKEVWRCKTEEEAVNLAFVLNKFRYYWIPIETEGKVFIEKIIL